MLKKENARLRAAARTRATNDRLKAERHARGLPEKKTPEQKRAAKRAYVAANPDKKKAWQKAWADKNPDYDACWQAKRRDALSESYLLRKVHCSLQLREIDPKTVDLETMATLVTLRRVSIESQRSAALSLS